MNGLTIGQVASRAGVGVETIRFYERKRLIEHPERPLGGYRKYGPEVVSRVRFIRRAKELGFSLREIAELLALRLDLELSCDEVRSRAEAKIGDIELRMATLGRMKKALENLVTACVARGSTDTCPILAALNEDDVDERAGEEVGG
jgi:MerR family mercuric resistance operon transcriptional regulator